LTTKISAKGKGDQAELILLTELVTRGCTVCVPWGEDQLFDLVVEHGKTKRLLKVQVKMRTSPKSIDTYTFDDLSRYIGNIDIMAMYVGGDWYFWGKVKLAKYGKDKTVTLKTKYNLKNNFKVFGC
jgi:hypothetical protein